MTTSNTLFGTLKCWYLKKYIYKIIDNKPEIIFRVNQKPCNNFFLNVSRNNLFPYNVYENRPINVKFL